MKKVISLSILLASVFTVQAQPVINSSFFPDVPGASFNARLFSNAAAINPGGTGNQTWNFGNQGSGTQNTQITFSGPSGSPYSGEFPGTNLVSRSTNAQGSAYFHYLKNAEKLVLVGSVVGENQTRTYLQNGEDTYYYTHPFNQKKSDTFYGKTATLDGTDTVSVNERQGTVSYTYDAYGTLTTPAGTFPNCVRISQRRVYRDSTYFLDFPVSFTLEQRSRAYYWLAAGPAVSPLKMTLSYDTIVTLGFESPVVSASFVLQPTAVEDPLALDENWTVSPNPTTDFLILMSTGSQAPKTATLYSLHGKSETVSFSDQNKISVAHLPRGIYWIEVERKGVLKKTKFVKQ